MGLTLFLLAALAPPNLSGQSAGDRLMVFGDIASFYPPGHPRNCLLNNQFKRGEPVGFRMNALNPATGKRDRATELVVHLTYAGRTIDLPMRDRQTDRQPEREFWVAKWIVPEDRFKEVSAEDTAVPAGRLDDLVRAALEARAGGVRLFTPPEEHLGVAVLTMGGHVYRAAGADDAAFHYRYPLGAALQQAASYRDYFVQAVVVAGQPGRVPRLTYRDRQYGYESSSFNRKRDLPPIRLILVEEPAAGGARRYRSTTFEEALPGAFSTADFMPEAVDRFLGTAPR